jgi:hypothetical protein
MDDELFEVEVAVPVKVDTEVETPEVALPDTYHLTPEEVRDASKTLNLHRITTESIEAHKIVGQHAASLGVMSVGRGLLIRSADQMVSIMEMASKEASRDGVDDDLRIKLLGVAAKAAGKLSDTAVKLMDTGQVTRPEDGGGVRLLPAPGQKIIRKT